MQEWGEVSPYAWCLEEEEVEQLQGHKRNHSGDGLRTEHWS